MRTTSRPEASAANTAAVMASAWTAWGKPTSTSETLSTDDLFADGHLCTGPVHMDPRQTAGCRRRTDVRPRTQKLSLWPGI